MEIKSIAFSVFHLSFIVFYLVRALRFLWEYVCTGYSLNSDSDYANQ